MLKGIVASLVSLLLASLCVNAWQLHLYKRSLFPKMDRVVEFWEAQDPSGNLIYLTVTFCVREDGKDAFYLSSTGWEDYDYRGDGGGMLQRTGRTEYYGGCTP